MLPWSRASRTPIADFDEYHNQLERLLGRDREVMRQVIEKASRAPKRLVFPEGDHPKIIRAAHICLEEGIAQPSLLGNPNVIEEVAKAHEISLDGIEIIDHKNHPSFDTYTEAYWQLRNRRGGDAGGSPEDTEASQLLCSDDGREGRC